MVVGAHYNLSKVLNAKQALIMNPLLYQIKLVEPACSNKADKLALRYVP